MALPQLEAMARALAAELRGGAMRRPEVLLLLEGRGLSSPEATAVLSYAIVAGLVRQTGELVAHADSPGGAARDDARPADPPGGAARRDAPPPDWLLLVEDDEGCADTLKTALEAEGHRLVRVAHHGKEALRLLARAGRPRVILLDLVMPEMNGWELLQILRDDPELSHVPVVVISGSKNVPRDVAVVKKPIDLDALVTAVDQALLRSPPAAS
jgi:CheY-like chemotaxis protein